MTRTVPAGGRVDEGPECSADISRCVEKQASNEAAAALLAAALGFALAALGLARGSGWCAAAGLVSTVLLGAHTLDFFEPDISLHSGYWLTLLLFAWSALLHARRAWRRRARSLGRQFAKAEASAEAGHHRGALARLEHLYLDLSAHPESGQGQCDEMRRLAAQIAAGAGGRCAARAQRLAAALGVADGRQQGPGVEGANGA